MTKLPHANSFRELLVYQKARALAKSVFTVTVNFPREETYSLIDQIRRSSRSVGAQIAEAWAKRRYEKHFASKLTDADGEQMETQHWIGVAYDCGYIQRETAVDLRTQCEEIGKMLWSMIENAADFCNANNGTLREEQDKYLTDIQEL